MTLHNYLYLLICLMIGTACNQASNGKARNEDPEAVRKKNTDKSISSLNSLSQEEQDKGWELLFDGNTTQGWHSYLKESLNGWKVSDGILFTPGKQGDIVTDREFEDFELMLEWKIEDQGNSGVFYYVVEDPAYKRISETGPEFQIIDDENYPQILADNQKTGSNSDVKAPSSLASKKPGEWNHTRIKANKGKIEHWLNRQLVLEFDMQSTEWKDLVGKSKFAAMDYAKVHTGRIGLQDHGGPVYFKNIKIRKL